MISNAGNVTDTYGENNRQVSDRDEVMTVSASAFKQP